MSKKKNPFEPKPYPAKKIITFPKVSKTTIDEQNFNINLDLAKPLRDYELAHIVQVILSMPLIWDSTNKYYKLNDNTTKLDDLLAELQQKTEPADNQNVKTLHDLATYKTATFYASADGDIVPLVAGKKIKVHYLDIQAQGTVTVTIRDGIVTGTRLDEWKLQDREGAVKAFVAYPASHYVSLQTAGNALFADLSAAVTVKINVIYTDADTT